MRPLLRDRHFAARFAREGFVVVPLLDEATARGLADAAQRDHATGNPGGFDVSLEHRDLGRARASVAAAREALDAPLAARLDRHRIVSGSFATKRAGADAPIPAHQDWSYVDEDVFASVTVWVALVDVDAVNGAVGVAIPGSHLWSAHRRGSPFPHCGAPFAPHTDVLSRHLVVQPMRRGEAILIDNRTLHGSASNRGDADRPAVVVGVTHAEAPSRHDYLLPGTATVGVYEVDDDFYVRWTNARLAALFESGGVLEDAVRVGERAHGVPSFDAERISAWLRAAPAGQAVS